MKTLLTFLLAFNFIHPPTIKLTGTVVMDGEELPGCTVRLSGTSFETMTNIDGEFELETDTHAEFVELRFTPNALGVTTAITQIPTNSSHIDLGPISVFMNVSIDSDDFEKLTKNEKQEYQPVYCWADLLGYMHKNKMDTTELQKLTALKPTYESASNTVIIKYQELINRN